MKALSIRQPWAWAIVSGIKPVENRSWSTKFRGEFLIHAAQKFDYDGFEWIKENYFSDLLPLLERWDKPKDMFLRGGIVGKANLVDCVTKHDSNWFFGPYGFVLTDAVEIPFAPCRGKLSFFKPEVEV